VVCQIRPEEPGSQSGEIAARAFVKDAISIQAELPQLRPVALHAVLKGDNGQGLLLSKKFRSRISQELSWQSSGDGNP